tara:strand:- start:4157 stop:4774 length:618 start_codon:yes stop_codon:yes gene_type:complete
MLRTETTRVPNTVEFHSDARTARLFAEHRKLENLARNIANAHPKVFLMGTDPVVDQLAFSMGFPPTDLVVLRLSVAGRSVTAIAVHARVWLSADAKSRAIELKRESRRAGTTCILVPHKWLKAGVRSSVARTISRARNVRHSRAQMNKILEHLREARISTIAEAAGVLDDHEDPIAVVLALASQGFVDLDRRAPLSGSTWLSTRF